MSNKLFFWKDKSGRGFASPFSEPGLIETFDDDTSWDGETIKEWLEGDPDVGDRWENAANEVTRTV